MPGTRPGTGLDRDRGRPLLGPKGHSPEGETVLKWVMTVQSKCALMEGRYLGAGQGSFLDACGNLETTASLKSGPFLKGPAFPKPDVQHGLPLSLHTLSWPISPHPCLPRTPLHAHTAAEKVMTSQEGPGRGSVRWEAASEPPLFFPTPPAALPASPSMTLPFTPPLGLASKA